MKRSRTIELALMGSVPLMLAACDQAPPAPPPTAAYRDLSQCVSDGKVGADLCAKAYADAVAEQYREGPRFQSIADCQARYSYDECHYVQGPSGGWFMPALAGFMIGRATSGHDGYGYTNAYGGGFGHPLYRARADRGMWRSASGETFGAQSRGPSVAKTLSRGGFGMSSAARMSWGG